MVADMDEWVTNMDGQWQEWQWWWQWLWATWVRSNSSPGRLSGSMLCRRTGRSGSSHTGRLHALPHGRPQREGQRPGLPAVVRLDVRPPIAATTEEITQGLEHTFMTTKASHSSPLKGGSVLARAKHTRWYKPNNTTVCHNPAAATMWYRLPSVLQTREHKWQTGPARTENHRATQAESPEELWTGQCRRRACGIRQSDMEHQ